jgi:hypothetical protein
MAFAGPLKGLGGPASFCRSCGAVGYGGNEAVARRTEVGAPRRIGSRDSADLRPLIGSRAIFFCEGLDFTTDLSA